MQPPAADPADLATQSLDRAQLAALIEHLPLGAIVAEAPSGRLVVANDKVAEIWRRPFVASENVAEYGVYHGFHADGTPYAPDEWPLARTIMTGQPVSGEEIVFERGDGTRGVMEVSAGPIRDGGGRLVGGVVVFRDVTDERQLAEETLRSKDELLRLIAHDLRNPLAVIQGYAELAKRHVPAGPGADRVSDRLERIAANARRMARQLAGLVDAVVLRASQPLELQVQEIDLRDLLDALAEEYRACYSELSLDTQLPAEPLRGSYDVARMQSVFANLLDNAIKYSEPGSPICLQAERRDSSVEVRVSDRGIGISEEDRGHLFDPFFRAHNAAGYPGLGIGLAGSAKVVEQHGGRIMIDSELGTGTTVTIRLPVHAGAGA